MSRFHEGQIVRVTSDEWPDLKVEGRVKERIGGSENYVWIEGYGFIDVSLRNIEVIKEAPMPFYDNIDRDPVVGDIYLWSPGNLGRPSVNTINSTEGLEDFLPRRRVLIYDGIANTTVQGARW